MNLGYDPFLQVTFSLNIFPFCLQALEQLPFDNNELRAEQTSSQIRTELSLSTRSVNISKYPARQP